MPKVGQLKGTPARRAAFIKELRLLGEGPECVYWPWSDGRSTYASVHIDGVKTRASRWVYEQINGPLPERHGRGARGVLVLHTCDNPPCVRPSHLVAGTQDDNMKDAAAKGRMPGGRGKKPRGPLSAMQVAAIESDLRSGSMIQAQIAKKHGVSDATVSLIANGKRGRKATRRNGLLAADVSRILSLHSRGVRQVDIAYAFGVSQATISNVVGRARLAEARSREGD